jgi:hypothetical protein
MRSISKNSFSEATCMNVRRDNIIEMITGELSSVDGLLSPNVKVFYHRSSIINSLCSFARLIKLSRRSDDSILCSLMSRLKLFFLHMKHKLLSMVPG